MKRILLGMSLLIMIFMVSCTLSSTGAPRPPAAEATATLSPAQVETQISAMLTVMPTATVQTGEAATPTLVLPTVEVGVVTATSSPESNSASAQATATTANTPEAQSPAATETSVPENTAAPTATTQPQGPTPTLDPGDPRARLGAPKSTDPMDNASAWVWPTGSDQFTSATFTNGMQAITSTDEKDGWRIANPVGREFTNTYIEATFKTNTCSGSDHYGIILRVPVVREPDQGYLFGVTCDGRYSLRRWNAEILPKGEMKRLVEWTASPVINAGSNQTNRLGIFAVGKRLILYVNGKLLSEVQDSTFSAGYFGVFAGYDVTENLVIQLDEMSYWENPQP